MVSRNNEGSRLPSLTFDYAAICPGFVDVIGPELLGSQRNVNEVKPYAPGHYFADAPVLGMTARTD